ncbi:alcohol dehydrogenase catalytic domain-containing protein [bacterium]|nr:alcohol dehydrogenase catalytic domain-containing protein [bacterium]
MTEPSATLEPTTQCRAALFYGTGQPLALVDLSVPDPGPSEAIVQIECCTVCGSDLHTIRGLRNEAVPTILGHEAVGRIRKVGTPAPCDFAGQPLQTGERVTWSVATACGDCDRCRMGFPQKCRTVTKYGHGLAEGRYALCGGMAEQMLLRRGTIFCRVPDSLSAELLAPVNCATATVMACYRMVGPLAGKRVLILGAGMLGLTAVAYAHEQQAAAVVISDISPQRLATANQFGATYQLIGGRSTAEMQHSLQHEAQISAFDVILELSGAISAIEFAYHIADLGATIVLAGSVMPTPSLSVDPERLVRQWLTLRGVHNYAPEDLIQAVAFLERAHDRYPLESLVERTFPLENVNEAVEYALAQRPVRVAIRPNLIT